MDSVDRMREKMRRLIFILISDCTAFTVGLIFINTISDTRYQFMFAAVLAFMLVLAIEISLALASLKPVITHMEKFIREPYKIKKVLLRPDEIFIHISKNDDDFCVIRFRYLNPDFLTVVVPLNTPLSFFQKSRKRIVGDGADIIETGLPAAVWDLHTEFDAGINHLIVKIDAERLNEDADMLSTVEMIKDRIESMEYSDEIIKKVPDEMVAANQYMKGHLCVKCGRLIPQSRLRDECPGGGGKHATKVLLLDMHPPYSAINLIRGPIVVGIVFLLVIEYYILAAFFPENPSLFILLIAMEAPLLMFAIRYYFHYPLAFKNMLRHFETKKRYVVKRKCERENTI